MAYALVLSDTLYREFHAFKHGLSLDSSLMEKLFHLYKPGEKRTKIRSYLPALLSDASWVIVHDRYALEISDDRRANGDCADQWY